MLAQGGSKAMAGLIKEEQRGRLAIVTIDRPERRNAVDLATARALYAVFKAFDADAALDVAILAGAGGNFCAGADLQAFASGERRPIEPEGDFAPMGCTRLRLSKPVIAAIEGYAVAGGLELALWCDLRVAARAAILGVFCRRFGVPLIDLGTIRLPRMIGQSRAMDLILTGRPVTAVEALGIGLVERLAPPGSALAEAVALARMLAELPQGALRADRRSLLGQWALGLDDAMRAEYRGGIEVGRSGESQAGAQRFSEGAGRHGN